MHRAEAVIKNETGLHARPASIFVERASRFKSEIAVFKDSVRYNGKSVMSILTLGASKGDRIQIEAEGEDEKKAVEELKNLIESSFGGQEENG